MRREASTLQLLLAARAKEVGRRAIGILEGVAMQLEHLRAPRAQQLDPASSALMMSGSQAIRLAPGAVEV